jgi:methionyl-tRNA synthetase
MAAEIELPKQIVAHGWLLFEQEKMSKSKGNVAYPEPIVKAFDELTGAKVGNDALRYYLLRETVFGQDGNFSREALITRYIADLANGLGNLASRVLTMIENYFGGLVPELVAKTALAGFGDSAGPSLAKDYYDAFDFSNALQEIWRLISIVDAYLVREKPWKIAEDPSNKEKLAEILYNSAEALRIISILAYPVLPTATGIIWKQLGQVSQLETSGMQECHWGGLKAGTKVSKPASLFPRVDYQEIYKRIVTMENEIRNPATAGKPGSTQPDASTTTTNKPAEGASTGTSAAGTAAIPAGAPGAGGPAATLGTSAAGTAATPAIAAPAKIGIEDFAKVELRVGVVKSAEKIAGAEKLLKVMVDIGDEVRQVLAGIAPAYAPEELVGRKVVVVTNLAPRKMRGVESNGMLLAASAGPDGKAVLCTFAEDIPAGAKVK